MAHRIGGYPSGDSQGEEGTSTPGVKGRCRQAPDVGGAPDGGRGGPFSLIKKNTSISIELGYGGSDDRVATGDCSASRRATAFAFAIIPFHDSPPFLNRGGNSVRRWTNGES